MLNVQAIRAQFPALNELYNGRPAIFFDNPGGTQVPQRVIDAMVDYLTRRNANTHGLFETSLRSDAVIGQARQNMADLLGAAVDEIIFGNNMTSLTFHLARSLAAEIHPGDEIIVTRADHDANVAPWLRLAEDRGARVRWAEIDAENCTLDLEEMQSLFNEHTKLVAVGYASNASGNLNDVKTIIGWAKAVGAYSFIDAVQYAAHGLIDVKALDCDFLACSAYKFFGPHVGILYGKRDHLQRLNAYRVRPAGEALPDKWETGTKNHEGLAGVGAAIDYLADLGVRYGAASPTTNQREKLGAAFRTIGEHESLLVERLIEGLEVIPGVRIYGITSRYQWPQRVATVSLRKEGVTPQALAEHLATHNVFAWNGNFYAHELAHHLGVEPSGGWLRLGLVHYNTLDEIDQCLRILERL